MNSEDLEPSYGTLTKRMYSASGALIVVLICLHVLIREERTLWLLIGGCYVAVLVWIIADTLSWKRLNELQEVIQILYKHTGSNPHKFEPLPGVARGILQVVCLLCLACLFYYLNDGNPLVLLGFGMFGHFAVGISNNLSYRHHLKQIGKAFSEGRKK